MKTKLLIASLTCLTYSFGQIDYRPIPEANATWIQAEFLYSAYNSHQHATVTSVVYLQGDTLIGGENYKKYGSHAIADWIDNFGSQQSQTTGTDHIPYTENYFRQDVAQKKVFLWNPINQTDELLYDFGNLIIGQPYPATITNINYPNLLVMANDSVLLMDGNYYNRWVLGTNSSDSAYVSVIEGVGGTNGFDTPIYPVFEQSATLLCHKLAADQIYENWQTTFIPPRFSEDCSSDLSISDQIETPLLVYPNPTNSILTISTDQSVTAFEIFNLNGQSVLQLENDNSGETSLDLNALEQGMYFLKVEFINGNSVTQQVHLIK